MANGLKIYLQKALLRAPHTATSFEDELINQADRREKREARILEIAERNQEIAEQELLRIRAKDERLLEIAERQLILAEAREMRESTQYISEI